MKLAAFMHFSREPEYRAEQQKQNSCPKMNKFARWDAQNMLGIFDGIGTLLARESRP